MELECGALGGRRRTPVPLGEDPAAEVVQANALASRWRARPIRLKLVTQDQT